jgi:hypothetical protein
MKTVRINVSKIDKSAIYEGKNGKYVDLVLFENRDGEDQYGNLGFVTQDLGKERRLAGEKGPIIGNFKEIGQPKQEQSAPAPTAHSAPDEHDDIPF